MKTKYKIIDSLDLAELTKLGYKERDKYNYEENGYELGHIYYKEKEICGEIYVRIEVDKKTRDIFLFTATFDDYGSTESNIIIDLLMELYDKGWVLSYIGETKED